MNPAVNSERGTSELTVAIEVEAVVVDVLFGWDSTVATISDGNDDDDDDDGDDDDNNGEEEDNEEEDFTS